MGRLGGPLGLAFVLLTLSPSVATARRLVSEPSENWAGEVLVGSQYTTVTASWRVPHARCKEGQEQDSAVWIGLGGYRIGARHLEQVGTELDCGAEGKESTYGWYELVPAPSVRVHLAIHPGDLIRARLSLRGHHLTITLEDRTTNRVFSGTRTVAAVERNSAEWVVEAPSECVEGGCKVLPLAAFTPVTFEGAAAAAEGGPLVPLFAPPNRPRQLVLVQSAASGTVAEARPSKRASHTGSFTVDFRESP